MAPRSLSLSCGHRSSILGLGFQFGGFDHLQKRIVQRGADATAARLLADMPDDRSKAMHLSHTTDPYTFTALPTCPDLTISNNLFPLCISRRLLLPCTTCSCEAHRCVVSGCASQSADIMGDHSLMCMADGNPYRRTHWHDASYRVWAGMLKSVGLSVRIEPSNALLSVLTETARPHISRQLSLQPPNFP